MIMCLCTESLSLCLGYTDPCDFQWYCSVSFFFKIWEDEHECRQNKYSVAIQESCFTMALSRFAYKMHNKHIIFSAGCITNCSCSDSSSVFNELINSTIKPNGEMTDRSLWYKALIVLYPTKIDASWLIGGTLAYLTSHILWENTQ